MKSFLTSFLVRLFSFHAKLVAENDRRIFFSELKKNPYSRISDQLKTGKSPSCLISKEALLFFGSYIDIRNNCNFVVGKNAELIIENNVFLNNSCSINCLEKIIIGKNTLFGEGVKLYDHNHQYTPEKVERQKFNTSSIIIGKNCWLGSNVIILKGVKIGNNSIIGAGCIIHQDVPENSVIMNRQEHIIKSH
jgi:acetyltransferase-like isoleucine patch superfamily enzyme